MSNIRPSNLPIEETDLIGFVHTDRGIDGSAKFNLANVSSALNLDGMATQAPSNVAITGGTITGITDLAVADGGTGASTLTGYVKGTGTAALTASATIPNTDITGLGTMSTQDAATVNIDGGAIDGTTIGATTPSTVAATTGTFSGSVKVSGPITNAAANSVLFAHNGTDAQVWALGPNPSTQGQLVIVSAQSDASGAAVAATFNASGGNGAWGATTPSTGAFTTLSANTTNDVYGLRVNAADSLMLRNNGTGDSQLWALGPNTSTNGTMTFVVADSDGSATSTFAVGSNTGLAVTGALSATHFITTNNGHNFLGMRQDTGLVRIAAGNSQVQTWSVGATAVTGTLSATGTINAAQNFLLGSAAPAADTTTLLTFQGSNLQRNWRLGVNVAAGEVTLTPSTANGGTTYTTPVVTVTTAGLAVTGTLSATGNAGVGNAGVPTNFNFQTATSGANTGGRIGTTNICTSSSDYPFIGYNIRATNSSNTYNYHQADKASALNLHDGGFRFFGTSTVGVAGDPITFNTFATLTSTGLAVTGTITSTGAVTMGSWPIIGNDGNATYALQSATAITAYTAGTATGTLTNAPAAGNPTKWITINDNGTLRRIPTW
jgi:hypothetical protein